MNAANHTPGPWRVGYRALDIVAPNQKGGEAKIFDVRGWGYLTGGGHGALGLTWQEAEAIQTANAHLAAAAPDMLAALKYARRFLREVDHDVAFVDAAIAKAEGRSDG